MNTEMVKVQGSDNRQIYVKPFPDNEVWLSIAVQGGSASALFTKESIAELIAALQAATS